LGIKSFLKLVEIKTKAASMNPFLLGTVFTYYRYRQLKWENFLLMLISLLCFDMTTTAINNYMDYKKAKKKEGFGYEQHNAIVRDNLSESHVVAVILILLVLAVLFGIFLYLRTSLIVLIIGIISFGVGIFYTFGPVPISRIPLGEFFSGFFMGFVILFLSVYIHITDLDIMELFLKNGVLYFHVNLEEIAILFLVSLPAFMGISNIMLANNICDMEEDYENHRYTLPLYIGRKKALALFQALYVIAFLDILLLIISGVLPITVIPELFLIFPVYRNTSVFLERQSKKDTFSISIKNFLLINIGLIILLIPGIFL